LLFWATHGRFALCGKSNTMEKHLFTLDLVF
jgi:hypothetical protein